VLGGGFIKRAVAATRVAHQSLATASVRG